MLFKKKKNYVTPINLKQASYRETQGETAASRFLCAHLHLSPTQALNQQLANRWPAGHLTI